MYVACDLTVKKNVTKFGIFLKYLGSTVIRELHGTTSTRKSILKFKRNATPLPVVKERESNLVKDCNNLTKMLKESNQDTRLKVGLAVSCGGVKFLNADNSVSFRILSVHF